MRKFVLIPTAVAVAGLGLVQSQENAHAQVPNSSQGQKETTKTVVSGGDNMGTYIDAVQANVGNPNLTVTLPRLENNGR